MFSTLDIAINIDDELATLLTDYASYVGDDSGLVPTSPLPEVLDPPLVTADPGVADDTTTTTTPTDLPFDPATATDPATVVDPMVSSDTLVFTGNTAPTSDGSAPPTDVATAGEAPPADLPIDPTGLLGVDGLVDIGDGSFAFDLSILEVGRTFGGPSFMDLQ